MDHDELNNIRTKNNRLRALAEERKTKRQNSSAEERFANKRSQLTPRTLAFIREWAAGNSPSAAALRAGYASPSIAFELVRTPDVVALYQKEKAKYEAAGNMTRKKVMDMLQESYDMAKLMSEPQAMVAAVREIGKMCGYYAPVERKIKIEGNVMLDKLNRLTDTELLEILQQGNKAVGQAVVEEVAQIQLEEDGETDLDEDSTQ